MNNRASLFDSMSRNSDGLTIQNHQHHLDTVLEDDGDTSETDAVEGLEEPLVDRRDLFKKGSMDDSDMNYFYQTGESNVSNTIVNQTNSNKSI